MSVRLIRARFEPAATVSLGLALALCAFPALAEDIQSSSVRPLPPLKDTSFLHDFSLSVSEGYGRIKSRSSELPDTQHDTVTGANLAFQIGERGFAMLGGSFEKHWGHTTNSPANGSLPLADTTHVLSGRVSGGYFVLPYLAVGGSYGWGRNWGYSNMNGSPTVDLDGRGQNVSPFALLTVPQGAWTYRLLGSYTAARGYMHYTNNVPDYTPTWSHSSTLQPGVSYNITKEWAVRTSVAWNHTFNYNAGEFELGTPRNWAIASIGTSYDITPDITLSIDGNTWINQNYKREQAILSAKYKF